MSRKTVVYYRDARGKSPVKEFLYGLGPIEKGKAFAYVGLLEESGEELRRPISDYLGDKIYELRPKETRILYGFVRGYAVILHAFRKKTKEVPPEELRTARTRLSEIVRWENEGRLDIEEESE